MQAMPAGVQTPHRHTKRTSAVEGRGAASPFTVTVLNSSWPADPSGLTGVTIDVCMLKLGLNFSNPRLLALTRHLGGGGSLLRIGGSDQNNFK